MNQLQKDIDELLRRDAIAEAEEKMGTSYKENEAVTWLGMGIMQDIGEQKKAAAILTNDTYYDMKLDDYIACIERIGFKKVYHKHFEDCHCNDTKPMKSEQFMFWHDKFGILLNFDTFYPDSVNGGNFYYCVRPKDWHNFDARSSGGGDGDGLWFGSHDCREAVKHHIEMLQEQAEFLPKWPKRPWLWLLNWSDTNNGKKYDYEAINESRISELPEQVRNAIGQAT